MEEQPKNGRKHLKHITAGDSIKNIQKVIPINQGKKQKMRERNNYFIQKEIHVRE